MGSGIAQVAAAAGHTVLLADVSKEVAQKACSGIAQRLAGAVEKGKMDRATADGIVSRLQPVGSPGEFNDVGIAIEAVAENVELKLRVFRELDAATPATAILASNTSSISITRIAAATRRPEQVMGMHFMNPVPVMKLVELVRGLQTSDETTKEVKALAEKWGKTTVLANDLPGFLVNRLLIPFLNEACDALLCGVASVEDIDTSIKLGLNHPMGPFQLADLIGLDTVLAISRVLHEGLGDPKYAPNPLLFKYVEAGWLGRKTGRGFHQYG
jgi:3-hydroxybutyryl-CoA dehydrogenase